MKPYIKAKRKKDSTFFKVQLTGGLFYRINHTTGLNLKYVFLFYYYIASVQNHIYIFNSKIKINCKIRIAAVKYIKKKKK